MLPHDGYIKYTLHWRETSHLLVPQELIAMRNLVAQQGWIGVYPDGIGFGNISMRVGADNSFIISGTQTGHLPVLDATHFCLVESTDISNNALWCSGPVKASSEALTHAAFYAGDPDVHAVIHIHHPVAWKYLLDKIPTVGADIAYGTPAMAEAVQQLMDKNGDHVSGVIVTAGHRDGLFAYGRTMQQVYDALTVAVQSSSTNKG